eukprot:scaffold50599_cov45-Attheya_sp.AAC.2
MSRVDYDTGYLFSSSSSKASTSKLPRRRSDNDQINRPAAQLSKPQRSLLLYRYISKLTRDQKRNNNLLLIQFIRTENSNHGGTIRKDQGATDDDRSVYCPHGGHLSVCFLWRIFCRNAAGGNGLEIFLLSSLADDGRFRRHDGKRGDHQKAWRIYQHQRGFYVIYSNKESNNKPHFVTSHSIGGLFALVGTTMIGMAGGVLLHPDFGIAKTNKTFRLLHKWAGRIILLVAWFTCFAGLNQLTADPKVLALFGFPLLALIPFTLM